MSDQKINVKPESVHEILNVLATIISGLSAERKRALLKDMSLEIEQNFDHTHILKKLMDRYDKSRDATFILELTRKIQNTQSFYLDVSSSLNKLDTLIKKSGISLNRKPYVFVLMPFQKNFYRIFEQAIRPPIQDLGCDIMNANDVHHAENIVDVIFKNIQDADLIIADTTGKNPNVFYEVGYAHGIGKKVIPIMQGNKDEKVVIPFDIAGIRHIIYEPTSLYSLEDEIKETSKIYLGV